MSKTETLTAAAAPVIDRMREDISAAVRCDTEGRSWYAITNRKGDSDDTTEIRIYGEVGAFGLTSESFVRALKAIKTKTIDLRINTPGGEAFDATTIYNALREHPAKIVVHVDGLAASAGSLIAMSGDEVRMANNAYLMIHNASGGIMGEAREMRAYASALEKITDNLARIYAAKSGKPRQRYREMMDAETWFTADEAKAEGLCDIVFEAAKKSEAASAKASFDFKIYNQAKIPEPVKQMWGMEEPNQQQAPEGDSPRGDSPPATSATEVPMGSTETAPAQNTVAEAKQQDPPDESSQLVKMTNDGWFKQGKAIGAAEATTKARDRLQEIVAACPGKPQMALDAFLNGQGPESVKLAYDAEARAEARAREEAKEKDLKIKRLEALIATGGHSGVALRMESGIEDDGDDSSPKRPPKEQAEWEWDNLPAARKSASSKDIYVLARAAELDGTHRSFSREPVNA